MKKFFIILSGLLLTLTLSFTTVNAQTTQHTTYRLRYNTNENASVGTWTIDNNVSGQAWYQIRDAIVDGTYPIQITTLWQDQENYSATIQLYDSTQLLIELTTQEYNDTNEQYGPFTRSWFITAGGTTFQTLSGDEGYILPIRFTNNLIFDITITHELTYIDWWQRGYNEGYAEALIDYNNNTNEATFDKFTRTWFFTNVRDVTAKNAYQVTNNFYSSNNTTNNNIGTIFSFAYEGSNTQALSKFNSNITYDIQTDNTYKMYLYNSFFYRNEFLAPQTPSTISFNTWSEFTFDGFVGYDNQTEYIELTFGGREAIDAPKTLTITKYYYERPSEILYHTSIENNDNKQLYLLIAPVLKDFSFEHSYQGGYDKGRDVGYNDGLKAGNQEAFDAGYREGSTTSFAANIGNWIVPVIVVILFATIVVSVLFKVRRND